MGYQPIDSYAVIGDMHTAALVNLNGSIDWLCLPRFDAPAVFAAILDDEKGGFFKIAPAEDVEPVYKQYYWPNTNVLVTRFLSPTGGAEVVDFMPVGGGADFPKGRRHVVRRVSAVHKHVRMRMVCKPAFDFGREGHLVEAIPSGVSFVSASSAFCLTASIPITIEDGAAIAEFTLRDGDSADFILHGCAPGELEGAAPVAQAAASSFSATVTYWRDWLSQSTYRGRWREMVDRSALALKLMTYEPTGAIVAAPTTSLPEDIGGERNWDYRYTWLRDSAFTVFALVRLGFTHEATRFANFLHDICATPHEDGSLQIMYGIDGRKELPEQDLSHLDGYRGSKPVRTGNGAFDQLQLDVYGELLDALYLFNNHVRPIGRDAWATIRTIIEFVCDNWQRPDEGIWETRGGRQHFVYSKLMCWVAIDRALKIASSRSLPADRERWMSVRDTIYEEIMERGWDEELGIFTQHYDNKTLDAANLMMVLTFFLSPGEPRALRLLNAVRSSPKDGGLMANSLVYRYNHETVGDGLGGGEGTFNLCTFWLVDALAHSGRFDPPLLDEAQLIFERMLGFANHVGLFSEETGAAGEALGNFPQALTHLGLITAAMNLDSALDDSGPIGTSGAP
ncbi:MAG: glycoside hydrolase family 15 protein [Pseudomonadota bacterium]